MARASKSVSLQVTPGQPRLAWQSQADASPGAAAALSTIEVVGATGPGRGGRLIACDDNLSALAALAADGLAGSVDLIYIDPPFMAGSDRWAYVDTWPGGLDGYLDMLGARLRALQPLLARTGNLFVHLDWHAVHYAKVLLDEIFGRSNFRNEIIWRRANAHSDPSRFGVITDTILFYAASSESYWSAVTVPHGAEYIASHWRRRDAGGRFRLIPLDAPRHGDGGRLLYTWRGKRPASTRTWAIDEAAMAALEQHGELVYTDRGTPNRKRYLADAPGARAQNLWDDLPPVNPMAKERVDYPTQKPVALLERIIAAACPPEGLVLDAFLGSGTTAIAATRTGRRFIGIDSNSQAILCTRARLLELAGQRASGRLNPGYSECDHCHKISPLHRRAPGAVLPPPTFTVESVGAALPVDRLPAADQPGLSAAELRLRVEQRAEKVTLQLQGNLDAVAAWSVDWSHVGPVVRPTTHLLRPRRGTVASAVTHVYAPPGPRALAVVISSDDGRLAHARVALANPGA